MKNLKIIYASDLSTYNKNIKVYLLTATARELDGFTIVSSSNVVINIEGMPYVVCV